MSLYLIPQVGKWHLWMQASGSCELLFGFLCLHVPSVAYMNIYIDLPISLVCLAVRYRMHLSARVACIGYIGLVNKIISYLCWTDLSKSAREHITWRDHKFEQGQHDQTVGEDGFWNHDSETIDSFSTFLQTSFIPMSLDNQA